MQESDLELIIAKTQSLVSRDLNLDRTNFVNSMLIFSTRHHFYVTMLMNEKIKVEKLEQDLVIVKSLARNSYRQSKGARVAITKKEEDDLLIESDTRVFELTREINLRKRFIEYLTEVSKIFASQKYVFTAIKDMLKIEGS